MRGQQRVREDLRERVHRHHRVQRFRQHGGIVVVLGEQADGEFHIVDRVIQLGQALGQGGVLRQRLETGDRGLAETGLVASVGRAPARQRTLAAGFKCCVLSRL